MFAIDVFPGWASIISDSCWQIDHSPRRKRFDIDIFYSSFYHSFYTKYYWNMYLGLKEWWFLKKDFFVLVNLSKQNELLPTWHIYFRTEKGIRCVTNAFYSDREVRAQSTFGLNRNVFYETTVFQEYTGKEESYVHVRIYKYLIN